jgi:RNA polymerase sigma-70 factor (ECF subfamily)
MRDQTDEALIALFNDGRKEAFDELMRRYQDRVYWTIRRMIGDADEAYDLTQDVFIKAHAKLGSFRGDAQFFTWLYRIASNLSINHLRRKKLRTFFSLDDILDLEDSAPAPAVRAEESELQARIAGAIRRLPEKQRSVFIMRYYDDLPYEEMAAITGRSVGGLKANYFHAVRKMQDYLRDDL